MENVQPKQKKPRITIKQRRAARLMADAAIGKYKPKNSHELVRKAGYKESVAVTAPGKVLENPGTKAALAELGFNSETAKKVVAQILENSTAENRDRLKAADLVFKVTGDYASDKIAKENANINPVIFAKIENTVFNFESELKKALGYNDKINTQLIEERKNEE